MFWISASSILKPLSGVGYAFVHHPTTSHMLYDNAIIATRYTKCLHGIHSALPIRRFHSLPPQYEHRKFVFGAGDTLGDA